MSGKDLFNNLNILLVILYPRHWSYIKIIVSTLSQNYLPFVLNSHILKIVNQYIITHIIKQIIYIILKHVTKYTENVPFCQVLFRSFHITMLPSFSVSQQRNGEYIASMLSF